MISPTISFLVLASVFLGALTHLVSGGNLNRLLLFTGAAFIGGLVGQGLGQVLGITVIMIGRVNVVGAFVGILSGIMTARILDTQTKKTVGPAR